jgi:hypothetical protein
VAVSGDLFDYAKVMFSEAPGRDRDEAVAKLFARFDQESKGRRRPAEARYRVVRVRRLGPNWWSIAWRKR